MDQARITRFVDDANALIGELGDYAAATGERDESDAAIVRRLRIVTGALVGALDNVARLPPPGILPPPPAPVMAPPPAPPVMTPPSPAARL